MMDCGALTPKLVSGYMIERLRMWVLQWLSEPVDSFGAALDGRAVSPSFQGREARRLQLAEKYRNGRAGGVGALAQYAAELECKVDVLRLENEKLRAGKAS
jgi:hypothetical protein